MASTSFASSSPLTFGRVQKRRAFECSSGEFPAADQMDCSVGHSAKRRRKDSCSSVSFQAKENWNVSPFIQTASIAASAVGKILRRWELGVGRSNKRTRTSFDGAATIDAASSAKLQELQRVVEEQAAEIRRLKAERDSARGLTAHNEKLEGENKLLKRAVTIQNDRQHQVNAELEGARQYKAQADDRIRRLEQMCLTLQYQLQANSVKTGNDFLNPRPPDVY
ncbi:hypothetical protein THAOC_02045 [Thalassiosira oceanica]|uniref:Uncharacterized protein n=1 Tax=Thalassiosira oceanica TaxID=159749 RepID=K0TMG9_THAOC|nr:hypothetical protein THAOC_02045 [Thalassiosira oceanica]|eukprot:EJK76211.1 hypothetical protein THAOC_02045 [Thalassiosira oceanica]